MIKFYKEDFRYYLRTPSYTDCGKVIVGEYFYHFKVRGESSNYLMNKYDLTLPNIRVSIDSLDFYGTCGADSDDKLRAETVDLDTDDLTDIREILMDLIDLDKRNYEEYICNSEYLHRDNRWK